MAAPDLPAEQPDLLADVRSRHRYRLFRVFGPGAGRPWKTAAVLTAVFSLCGVGDGSAVWTSVSIKYSLTGAVQEVTPVEPGFPANRPYLPGGSAGVVWNPGPRGLGLWWRHDPVWDLRLNRRLLDRYAWRERQAADLEHALEELAYALRQFDAMDLAAWEYGPPSRVYESMTRLKARYPAARNAGSRSAVPAQWVCDPNLERDLEGIGGRAGPRRS